MFEERIYIYDLSNNYVNDPERSCEYATKLQYSSIWPKGYESCSFVVRRDIAARWAVKSAYGIKIRDGHRIVYQGRLAGLNKAIQGTDEFITIRADGWYCILKDKTLRKRWSDNAAVRRLLPTAQNTILQNEFDLTKNDDYFHWRCGYTDTSRTNGDQYLERYTMPTGTKIATIKFDYAMRSGEGVLLIWYNDDQSGSEGSQGTSAGTIETGSHDDDFAAGDTESCTLKFRCTATDTFDQNDWIRVYNLWFYGKMDSFGSPNWYADEIGQDVLELVASSEISSDYDGLDSPSLEIVPFITKNDDFETADSILQRLAAFGDADDHTWGFSIWDDTGTSDSLPKAELKEWSVSDYEWMVSLSECSNFRDEEVVDEVKNWIVVKYTDDDNVVRYRSPDDDATLKDTDSIADYYERHYTLDAGNCDTTTATELGTRYLAYHKDPPHRMSFSITGWIRKKGGVVRVPCNHVRAGDRIKMVDWNDGETIFVRSARYDAESKVLSIERDLPPDSLEVYFAQQQLKVKDE